MLKRIGMIAISIAAAAMFTMLLPVVLTAWAVETDVPPYNCNANQGAQCSFVQVAPMTNTTATTTQILTTALPITVTIRITTESPVPEFGFGVTASIVLTDNQSTPLTETIIQTDSTRTAVVSIAIPQASFGQTRTLIYLNVTPRNNLPSSGYIEGNFIINHLVTSSVVPRIGPYTVTLPLVQNIFCKPFTEYCFGSGRYDVFEEAPEVKLETLVSQPLTGSLNKTDNQYDYYRLTFTDNQPYTISINAPVKLSTGGDFDIYLYKTLPNPICKSSFVGKSDEYIAINVKPCSKSSTFTQTTIYSGTYTLKVQYAFTSSIPNDPVKYEIAVTR